MSLAETVSKIDHLSEEERECIEICNEAAGVCGGAPTSVSATRRWKSVLGSVATSRTSRRCMPDSWLATPTTANNWPKPAPAPARECAEECERHDAEHCQVCAEVLTECAESCRNMMSA